MTRLPAGSVDAIITDPPYGSGGDTVSERLRSAKIKYTSSDSSFQSTLPDIDGDAIHPEQWTENMRRWLKECARVLAKDGVLVSFMDWRNGPTFQRLLSASGIRIRGLAVWDKGPGARPYPGGFRMQAELIYWGGGILPRRDLYLPGVLKHPKLTNGKQHITQKPLPLMRELVQICKPGGLILDPFAGSGSTGLAALEAGYRFLGYESHYGCFDVLSARMATAAPPPLEPVTPSHD